MNTESPIPSPFNPEEFRKQGHIIVDTLSDYLDNALSGKEMAVLPWNEPDELAKIFSFDSAGGSKEPVGSYDDLNAVADFCDKHGLWLHVDGAHGMGHPKDMMNRILIS